MSQIITTKHLKQQYNSEEDLIKKIYPSEDFEEYDSYGKKNITIR